MKCKACNNKSKAKGLCVKHYAQYTRTGKVMERTKFDSNEIFDRGSFMELAIYNQTHKIIGYMKFDRINLQKISKYKWHMLGKGYAITNLKDGRGLLAHHLIIKKTLGFDIDHINRNKLDNRINNLRLVERGFNIQNKDKRKNNTSGFIGISYCNWTVKKRWRAIIMKNSKHLQLGYFTTKEEAALMYDFWAIELYGQFAKTNFKVVAHG